MGGTATGAGNVVSANGREGVVLANAGTSGNFVQGNRIGTDWTGTHALGNTFNGVLVFGGASGNTVGGTAAGAGNQVSGNGWDGVRLADRPYRAGMSCSAIGSAPTRRARGPWAMATEGSGPTRPPRATPSGGPSPAPGT